MHYRTGQNPPFVFDAGRPFWLVMGFGIYGFWKRRYPLLASPHPNLTFLRGDALQNPPFFFGAGRPFLLVMGVRHLGVSGERAGRHVGSAVP